MYIKCDCYPSHIRKILHVNRSDQSLYGPPFHVPFTKIMLYWPVPIGSHFEEINCLLIAHSRNKTLQFYFWTQLFLASSFYWTTKKKLSERIWWSTFHFSCRQKKRNEKETSEKAVLSYLYHKYFIDRIKWLSCCCHPKFSVHMLICVVIPVDNYIKHTLTSSLT